MFEKVQPLRLFTAVYITTAGGFLLKYFNADTFIIILGFRFHLSLILPFLLISSRISFDEVKPFFTSSFFNRKTFSLPWLLILPLLPAIFYLTGLLSISDPDYFYEFGLSSIFDFPVYLIWNFPHLAALYIFLIVFYTRIKGKIFSVFGAVIFLLSFEFISFDPFVFNYKDIIVLVLIVIPLILLIKYSAGIYRFTFSVFFVLWSALLLSGSSSSVIIKIIFASQYERWEGFVGGKSFAADYFLEFYSAAFLLIVASVLFFRKKA